MRTRIPDHWTRHARRDSLQMGFLIAAAAGLGCAGITADQGGAGWYWAGLAAFGLVFTVAGTFFYGLHLAAEIPLRDARPEPEPEQEPERQTGLIACPYCQASIYISSDDLQPVNEQLNHPPTD